MESVAAITEDRAQWVRRWTPRLVAFGEFIDGYDLLCMGAALLFLSQRFHLSPRMIGWLAAVAYLGTTVGLVIFGDLADRLGRKVIFVINLMLFVAAAIGSAFVTEVWQLLVARFFVGIAVGMDIPTSQSFLAEIAPNQRRGRIAGSLPNIMWLSGASVSVLVALAIAPFAGLETWRWLFGLSAIPALAVLLARQRLPESPRWLMVHGRLEEAHAVLDMLQLPVPKMRKPVTGRYKALFSGDGLRRLLVVSAFFGLQGFGIAVVTIASPIIFSMLGFPTQSSLFVSLAGYMIGLAAVVSSSFIIDVRSRRKLGIYTSLAACLFGILMGLFGHLHSAVLLACFIAYAFAAWAGPGVLCWIWSSEVFPTEVRGLGSGIAQSTTRISVAANVMLVPLLFGNFGLKAILIYAFPYLLCALLVKASPFLDATQKNLEEA